MEILNDLLKPILLLLVGALSYFLKKEFAEIKKNFEHINSKLEMLPTNYIERRDCERTLRDCREDRRERKSICENNMKEMREAVSDLVTCVNKKWPDDCDVRNP